MVEASSTAAHCSVVFLRIRDASRTPSGAFPMDNAVLAEEDRIVLDSPDGIAVVVLGNPRGALEFANHVLDSAKDVALTIGMSHGPVRVVQHEGAAAAVAGDDISLARFIAELASPGRILASRSFRDHLLRVAPERGRYLAPAGRFTDRENRPHELFFADAGAIAARRRRFLVLATLGAGGILALGIAGRYAVQGSRPAAIDLDIKPEGDVLVDGVFQGTSPPLTRLQLSPGKHTIEIRNARYKSLKLEVDVKAGERSSLRHSFTAASSPKSAIRKFFDRFK
jgi:hypothetical protein